LQRYLGAKKYGQGRSRERKEINGVDVEELKELAEHVIHLITNRDEESAEDYSEGTPTEKGSERVRKGKERALGSDGSQDYNSSLPESCHRHSHNHDSSRNPKCSERGGTSKGEHGRRFGGLEKELEDMAELLTELNLQVPSHNHPDCEFYRRFVARSGPLQISTRRILGRIREINGDTYSMV
jgi:hypothetical protein